MNICAQHINKIFDECLSYKREKKISSCWSFNGVFNIKFTDDRSEKPIKIHSPLYILIISQLCIF